MFGGWWVQTLKLGSSESFNNPDGIVDITHLIKHHLRPSEVAWTSDKAVRRWIRSVGSKDRALKVLDLWVADQWAHKGSKLEDLQTRKLRMAEKLQAVGVVPMNQRDLHISGDVLRKEFGVEGKAIGALKEKLLEMAVDGSLRNESGELLAAARKVPVS